MELNRLVFKLNIIPPKSTHQSGIRIIKTKSGNSFPGRYDKGNSKQAKRLLASELIKFSPPEPMQGPVKLTVKWVYPFRKSEKKTNLHSPMYCDTRPDCDNLVKGLKDIMTDLKFYNDDGQIAHLDFCKAWHSNYGIYITLEKLNIHITNTD